MKHVTEYTYTSRADLKPIFDKNGQLYNKSKTKKKKKQHNLYTASLLLSSEINLSKLLFIEKLL